MIVVRLRHLRLATALCFLSGSSLHGADALRPLRVVEAEVGAESQVDEGAQEPSWVIRHCTGLRVVNIASGMVTDVLTHPRRRYGPSLASRLLTTDAKVFGYLSSDDGELTISRVVDGGTIAKVNPDMILAQLKRPKGTSKHTLWNQAMLAGDASHLWCLADRRIARIDLSPEPHVALSHELQGSARDAFNLFVSRDEPGLVTAVTSSPKGGWFYVFDNEARELYKRKLPQAGVSCIVNQPQPLILLEFPQTTTWQLLRKRGTEFQLVSTASYGPKRYEWSLHGWNLMAAAIAPDGKVLVTSQASERPTISVWNPATGRLIREIELTGGVAQFDVASHHTINRLAFSKSGKYLTATNSGNAFLVESDKLAETATQTETERR